jgi:hypothetical protein
MPWNQNEAPKSVIVMCREAGMPWIDFVKGEWIFWSLPGTY